jgi:hypothetical protein
MKSLGLVAVFAVLISSLMLAIIAIVFGWPHSRLPVETLSHPRNSFADEARRAIFHSPSLAKSEKPMILILGASAPQEAYLPSAIQALAPAFNASNLGVGGANISELDQVLDLVLKAARPQVLKESILVLTFSYGIFVPDAVRWSDKHFVPHDIVDSGILISDIEREAIRCPNICNPESVFFKFSPHWLLAAAKKRYEVLLHLVPRLPVHPGDRLLRWNVWRSDPRSLLKSKRSETAPPEVKQVAPESEHIQARRQMDFITKYMGPPSGVLHDEQFDRLVGLLNKAHAAGLRIVVLDMPLPSWHSKESPFFAPYENKLQAVLSPFLESGKVRYVRQFDAIPDDEFRDSIHPKAEAAHHWTKVLVDQLLVGR